MATQSITVNGHTWTVAYDPTESSWRGVNAAKDMVAQDLLHFDSTQNPQCEGARRVAIAKALSGTLPSGAS